MDKQVLFDNRELKTCPFFKKGDTFLLKRTLEQDDFYNVAEDAYIG
ncbi:hypothetical protein [Butyrivibrio sp. MC2013]|nr:hypothetical protein [Butyrivibrio sp. MC2013]